MRTVLVTLMMVLVCAPAARAEQLAPDVAAKLPMPETVMCSTDAADWVATLERFNAPTTPGLVRAFTERNTGVIHLPPQICADFRAPFTPTAAVSYRIAYHEFIHAALHTSVESQAECWSLFMYRYWLRRFFGANVKDAELAYEEAWADHTFSPPQYQGACVFEKRDDVSPLNGF